MPFLFHKLCIYFVCFPPFFFSVLCASFVPPSAPTASILGITILSMPLAVAYAGYGSQGRPWAPAIHQPTVCFGAKTPSFTGSEPPWPPRPRHHPVHGGPRGRPRLVHSSPTMGCLFGWCDTLWWVGDVCAGSLAVITTAETGSECEGCRLQTTPARARTHAFTNARTTPPPHTRAHAHTCVRTRTHTHGKGT